MEYRRLYQCIRSLRGGKTDFMSANNYILIKQTEKGYEITIRDADTNYQLGKETVVKTLEEAVKVASRIEKEEIVEYGIYFELKD